MNARATYTDFRCFPLHFSQVLQSESLVMEEELCRIRNQAELHRMQTTVIATLEGERAALERERDMLRSTVDALRTAQRKVGQCTPTDSDTQYDDTKYFHKHGRRCYTQTKMHKGFSLTVTLCDLLKYIHSFCVPLTEYI